MPPSESSEEEEEDLHVENLSLNNDNK